MNRVRINTSIYPTEDAERVMAALKNMFVFDDKQVQRENKVESVQLKLNVTVRYDVEVTRVVIEIEGKECLEKLKGAFKNDFIEECARSVLFSSKHLIEGNTYRLSFRLHKQAAYMGKVHFSELHESPLGPINIDITTDEPVAFIDWLAPRESTP
nr:RNA-binding domain-containing protein [Candidatus Sigynarchaeum springense]